MGTEILNQHLYFVLIILSETLESWKDLTSEEGIKSTDGTLPLGSRNER